MRYRPRYYDRGLHRRNMEQSRPNNWDNQQFQHPYNSLAEQQFHQTPFQYYAKPSQLPNWPNQMNNNFNYDENINPTMQSNFLTQFQTTGGQLDVEKMLSTVSQLAHTVQQVSPVIKQFGSAIKSLR